MEPEQKEVENKADDASNQQQEVKKEESGASADQGDDVAKQLAAKDAEIAKIAAERDNYKKGLLKAKGKFTEDDEEEQPSSTALTEEQVRAIAREEWLSNEQKRLQAEKDAILQQALKENAEMKVALANKQGISNKADGGSADNKTTTPQYFSDEQIRELKARGWDDAKIKKAAERMQAR